MTDKVIPCGSDEMIHITWHLRQADNQLITAQDESLGDAELHERILEVRRLLTKLIDNITH